MPTAMNDRDKFYQERANGRFEYWTYSEGRRVYVSVDFVKRELARGRIRLIEVSGPPTEITAWK